MDFIWIICDPLALEITAIERPDWPSRLNVATRAADTFKDAAIFPAVKKCTACGRYYARKNHPLDHLDQLGGRINLRQSFYFRKTVVNAVQADEETPPDDLHHPQAEYPPSWLKGAGGSGYELGWQGRSMRDGSVDECRETDHRFASKGGREAFHLRLEALMQPAELVYENLLRLRWRTPR